MSPIKDFTLNYENLNEEGIFSEGDTVTGAVSFILTEDTKVKSLVVKMKGDANVHWTEGSGEDSNSYSAHRRYFKVKEGLVAENIKGTVLPKGVHRFKFRMKIPQGDMPSSFKGKHGKIVYVLEAKMSRSWRWPSTVQTELKFVSKSLSHHGQVMCPQSGSVGKELGVFSRGKAQMSATINKKVCSPGDTLSVVAKICNSSSKTMRPKFSLQQKIVYRASGSTNTSDKCLCKIVGDTIAQNSEETVSYPLKIPDDVILTIENCEILSVSHYLRVYLDISFAFDPEVVFLLIIVPSRFAAHHPAGAVGAPSYSDFPPPAFPPGAGPPPAPAFPTGHYPAPAGPSAYGYPAPGPTQHANTTGAELHLRFLKPTHWKRERSANASCYTDTGVENTACLDDTAKNEVKSEL
ncbi:arrestin domain-containing protein 3-like isoform 2-T2 [Symphorus nematophorus]